MPLYEYRCKQCGKKFEQLVMTGDGAEIRCPHCNATAVEKQFSTFSSAGSKGSSPTPPCGSGGCCPGCNIK